MTPEQNELGRRAAACKGWRWVEGMRVRRWDDHLTMWERNRVSLTADRDTFWLREGWVPDLGDPATRGCLLALVREAYGDPRLVAIYCEPANYGQSEGWAIQCADNRLPVAGDGHAGEAEALVAALDAAP
jgi:hypothetical protein